MNRASIKYLLAWCPVNSHYKKGRTRTSQKGLAIEENSMTPSSMTHKFMHFESCSKVLRWFARCKQLRKSLLQQVSRKHSECAGIQRPRRKMKGLMGSIIFFILRLLFLSSSFLLSLHSNFFFTAHNFIHFWSQVHLHGVKLKSVCPTIHDLTLW